MASEIELLQREKSIHDAFMKSVTMERDMLKATLMATPIDSTVDTSMKVANHQTTPVSTPRGVSPSGKSLAHKTWAILHLNDFDWHYA